MEAAAAARTQSVGRTTYSRDVLEKTRLLGRYEAYERHRPETIINPFHIAAKTGLYQPDHQRWKPTTTANELKLQRDQDRATREIDRVRVGNELQNREDERWRRMQTEVHNEADRLTRLREERLKAKRNEGSVPYDLITLSYGKSDEARKMKSHDDLVRYRAALRMRHLAMKQNTHGTNPITGEATPFSPPPPRPAVYQPSSSSASSSSSAFGRRSSAAAESANTYTNTSNDSNASSSNSSSNSRSNSLSGPSIGTRNNRGGGVASALGFGGSFDPT